MSDDEVYYGEEGGPQYRWRSRPWRSNYSSSSSHTGSSVIGTLGNAYFSYQQEKADKKARLERYHSEAFEMEMRKREEERRFRIQMEERQRKRKHAEMLRKGYKYCSKCDVYYCPCPDCNRKSH